MEHDWKDLIGKTIGNGHVLAEFRGSTGDMGRFLTGNRAVIELVPADSPDAAPVKETWPATARLRHPNLIGVLDSGTDDLDGVRVLYRVTERPEDSVGELLPERPLTEEEARQVLGSLVPALAYLHDNGFVHGAVRPENIVAVGTNVKLTLHPVRPGGADAVRTDIVDLGRTVVEMLTQKRPDARPDFASRLPVPFGPIAGGTIAHGWTLEMVGRALAGHSVTFPAAPVAASSPAVDPSAEAEAPAAIVHTLRSKPLMIAAAALAVVLLVVAFTRPSKKAATPVAIPVTEEPRPSPVVARNPAAPPPAAPRSQANRTTGAEYAVVAATYKYQDAAEKRAQSLRKSWKRSQIGVEPQGSYYVVTLASGVTRQEAERIQKQARAAGLPRDTHVTKIR